MKKRKQKGERGKKRKKVVFALFAPLALFVPLHILGAGTPEKLRSLHLDIIA
jgi:hypothetical protein